MSEKHPRPAWGWLLLIPVPGAAFVLYIERLHVSPVMFDMLGLVGLAVLGFFIEVWRVVNRSALMHITAADGSTLPLYAEREAVFAKPVRAAPPRRLVRPREYVAPSVPELASELLE